MIRFIKNMILLFSMSLLLPIVTDIDGNTYETVLIGDQLWMSENLKTTHYRNGNDNPQNLYYANYQPVD